MIEFVPECCSHYQNRIGFEIACKNPDNKKMVLEVEIYLYEVEKYEQKSTASMRDAG